MGETEVPQYFLCPISLQIIQDPVTTITGITYDRESIEKWLNSAKGTPTCPVTKQPLPRESELTPNHTLRRLIQSWCSANSMTGMDRLFTSSVSPPNRTEVIRLIKDLEVPRFYSRTLKKMEDLAMENDKSRAFMVEAGVAKALVGLITRCFKEGKTAGLKEALRILYLIWNSSEVIKNLVKDNQDLIESLTWALRCDHDRVDNSVTIQAHAIQVLCKAIEFSCQKQLERLRTDFFKTIVNVLKQKISQQTMKSALLILIEACPWGRNRMGIVEAGAVFQLIELELEKPEKNITELIFNLLSQLCSSADGRSQLLKHAGGIALLSKRIIRVSPATDDRALHILDLISKFSATNEVLMEMLKVGAVSKLCMVIQADCAPYLKKKARGILRMHNNVWNNSPCIAVYLLTRYPR
ncbi:hypothetical protein Tsubulata_016032 [Turnera subulata]|uniref:U-box domain-containing protein n=1 Tax=Turnera subulata TaxID=218843 RepID=A0A9Q0F8N6_9ROSI|nr:hypothetical protein Tsubulata_016032 [Turnera subulata]